MQISYQLPEAKSIISKVFSVPTKKDFYLIYLLCSSKLFQNRNEYLCPIYANKTNKILLYEVDKNLLRENISENT